MEEQAKRVSFWQTLPGILTGVAALLTAVTGLVVGVIQTGIFRPTVVQSEGAKAGASKTNPLDSPGGSRPAPGSKEAPTPNVGTLSTDILAAANGGKLIWATSQDWSRINIGPNDVNPVVVGAHNPEEAVFAFRGNHTAVLEMCRYLVRQVDPSNVRKLELYVSNSSAKGPFQSIGQFDITNAIFPDKPYQEFPLNSTKAKYLKIQPLLNQNGYNNPFVIQEVQILGHLEDD